MAHKVRKSTVTRKRKVLALTMGATALANTVGGYFAIGTAEAHEGTGGTDWIHLCIRDGGYRNTNATSSDVYVAGSADISANNCRSGYLAAHIPVNWSSISGAQGATGATGAQGAKGAQGF